MKNIKLGLFTVFFFCLCSVCVEAQVDIPPPSAPNFPPVHIDSEERYNQEKWERAETAITNLKEGVLLIRLSSERRKLEELDRRIANDKLDAKSRERLKRLKKEVIEDRDKTNQEFVTAFSNEYDFSELFFFYDTASVSLKRGVQEGIFLDKDMNLAPSISLEGRPFLVLRSGSLKENTSGLEALVIMDQEFEDLARPFPYYVRMRGIGHLLAKLLNPGKVSRRSGQKLAEKLNERLWEFHERL